MLSLEKLKSGRIRYNLNVHDRQYRDLRYGQCIQIGCLSYPVTVLAYSGDGLNDVGIGHLRLSFRKS
ncbi:hypothetical protein DPMN_037762 [Dreissena polymorpha]|uniref:Uncharacterized protein n=1 Tax=Dreissena polymorpha TaxID=45954 RepID=A0A9D4RQ47_DREPO|nr:hypothetical protein DPMN_037762 [Dreissena polymorpha]